MNRALSKETLLDKSVIRETLAQIHEAGRSAGPPEVVLFCELAKAYIFSLRINTVNAKISALGYRSEAVVS